MQSIIKASSLIATFALASLTAHAEVIHVPVHHSTIQAAIKAASDGDEVVVAPGTYTENINFNGKAITLRSTDPTDPLVVYATVIDGGGAAPAILCINGETSATVIDGLLITNPLPNTLTEGGGLRIIGSAPTIRRSVFFHASAGAGHGGAAYIAFNAPTFEQCTFINCFADGNGGALWNLKANVIVEDCTFRNNSARFGGAAFSQFAPVSYTRCQFDNNAATAPGVGKGGALYNVENSGATLTECSLRGNSAVDSGGAIFSTVASPTTNVDTLFCENTPDHVVGDVIDSGGNQFLIACPPPGACCLAGACIQATQDDCAAAAGSYQGDGTLCGTADCSAACPADTVSSRTFAPPPDGIVDAADLAYLLSNWGACE